MCQLLGLAFNRPVSPGLSFRGFRHRATRNPDGWGIAAITPRRVTIHKEPVNALESAAALALPDRDPLRAPLFIGHVRAASRGRHQAIDDTHPFSRPLDGRELVLAHNGTIRDMTALRRLPGDGFTPAGRTDSELILGAILGWIDRERAARAAAAPQDDPRPDPLDDFVALENFLREVNDLGTMNLLFSDGRRLFCYFDEAGYHGLTWTRRRSPFERVSLRDEDWTAELGTEKERGQRGYVIATSPLTDGEAWKSFTPGRLVAFENGDAVYGLAAAAV
jgi:predicted glutamine amidotransferase